MIVHLDKIAKECSLLKSGVVSMHKDKFLRVNPKFFVCSLSNDNFLELQDGAKKKRTLFNGSYFCCGRF